MSRAGAMPAPPRRATAAEWAGRRRCILAAQAAMIVDGPKSLPYWLDGSCRQAVYYESWRVESRLPGVSGKPHAAKCCGLRKAQLLLKIPKRLVQCSKT